MPHTPPSAPSQVARLHGRFATCTFAGIGVLKVYDWEMEIHTEFADATAHGDYWDVPVPLKYMWTARVRGYFDTGTTSYLAGYQAAQTGTADITAVSFVAAKNMTPTQIFTANGYLVRARWAAPMGMVEQEAEIRGTGNPAGAFG